MKNKLSVVTGAVLSTFLCGCGGSGAATYNKIYSQVQQSLSSAADTGGATINTGINLVLYKFATGAKAITPAVVTGSVALGLLLLMIIKKDPVWRKRAIFVFIISIPVIMFLVSYGLAILLSIFVF